jgi:phosphoribosyl 1,2-cyclic phosphodiesterase
MTMARLAATFWGVRGSIACPGAATLRYGGDTACVEIRAAGRLLIFDAGTGIRRLGAALAAGGAPVEADLFFSHTHLDHVCGLPFFAPLYRPGNRLRLWAGHLLPERRLEATIAALMAAPFFPVKPGVFAAAPTFHDFRAGETLDLGGGLALRTAPLRHPDGATGYRVDFGGRAICYVTDTEHVPGRRDAAIVALARGADLLIYDCTYSDASFAARIGWGHSTWEEGARLCDAAGVARLAIFHHDPDHDDATMDGIAAAAAAARPGTVVARDGMTLTP